MAHIFTAVKENSVPRLPLARNFALPSRGRREIPRKTRRRKAMPFSTKYVLIVSMDVTPEKEALFNEVYDREHLPILLKVPGVRAATRLRTEVASFLIGGEKKQLTGEGMPKYTAVYEIDSPDVLTSAAWAEAGEIGRWAKEVRPFTKNRRHVVRKVL
jgi:hypothetical protein